MGTWLQNAVGTANAAEKNQMSGMKMVCGHGLEEKAGLPDFSSYNIPKRGKIYQLATKLPNGPKIYQMVVIYSK
jgi:hypothetical protein